MLDKSVDRHLFGDNRTKRNHAPGDVNIEQRYGTAGSSLSSTTNAYSTPRGKGARGGGGRGGGLVAPIVHLRRWSIRVGERG